VVRLAAITFSCYFVLCWLGGYSGIGPLWQQRLVPTLCCFGAFCLATLACSALAAALQPRARKLWIKAVIFWFGYGPLLALACLIFGDHGWPLNMSAPLIAASPLMSLYSFFRFNLDSSGEVAWWLGPLVQAVVGTLALALAQAGTVLGQSPDGSSSQERHPLAEAGRVLWFTLRWFCRVFGFIRCRPKAMPWRYVLRPVTLLWGHLSAARSRLDNAIAQRGIDFDNALLTAHVRSRSRRGGWCAQWLGWQLLAIGIWLISSHPWNIGTAPAARLEWAHSVTFCTVAAAAWVIVIYMTVVLAISSSRARGALWAAFVTPMSDEAILVGKLAPSLLRGFGPFCSLAVPLLSAVYVRFTVADYAPLWLGLCCLLLVYATLLCRAAWQLAAVPPGKWISANSKGALFKISLQLFLLASFIILASAYGYPVGVAFVLLGSMAAVVLGTAQYIWRAVIRSLASHRYGDVKAYGNRSC
jgi:hypothetical protein